MKEQTPPNRQQDDPTEISSRTALTVDYERYGKYLDESDWDENQKREFIDTLWSIIVALIDFGLEIHPVQQACEQNAIYREMRSLDLGDLLGCDPDQSEKGTKQPGTHGVSGEERSPV